MRRWLGLADAIAVTVAVRPVFTTGWGAPVHPDTVSSLVADLIKAHNVTVRDGGGELLPPARLHDLRHMRVSSAP